VIARAVTDNADERASSPVTDARHQPGADAAPEASDVPTRKFLMVSAPFGPFARDLANELRRHGAHMTRVLLNGGDLLDWGIRNAVPFFGALSQWRPWLVNLIGKERFTDILCYGDSSPYAVAAVDVAASTATRLHVLEQGYFRPDWVTLRSAMVSQQSGGERAGGSGEGWTHNACRRPAHRILPPGHVSWGSLVLALQGPLQQSGIQAGYWPCRALRDHAT
jgi:capsular polysaccharide export protein